MGFRVSILICTFSLVSAGLIVKLSEIQLQKGDIYKAKAASIQKLSRALLPVRGNIYFSDRDNNAIPAAISKDYSNIYVIPSEVKDGESVIKFLAELTGESGEKFQAMVAKVGDPYEPVLKRATAEQVDLVRKKNLLGVEVGSESGRFYPFQNLAAQLLGFVSGDSDAPQGKYGVELYHNDTLQGEAGGAQGDKYDSPKDGQDVYLTIDRNIQVEAERILSNLVTEKRATGGTVIVEDPKTGKILAMGSIPNFDPNEYAKSDIKTFLNPAVQAVYEPGSIFKIITMVSGLDAGKITPDTTFFDPGYLVLNGKKIQNWDLKGHGKITMTNVIEQSVNTGAAFAERALGDDFFYNYVVKFGFKKKTGVDLPGEVTGNLSPLEKNIREINFATASFGQGISVTPIELITALSTVANRGLMMKPYIDANSKPQELGRIVSEKAAKEVISMMVSAVDKAEIARIKGYTVAGKTGTAQVPDFVHGGYSHDVINTYIGFAPAYDPKFVVMVKLDKPEGAPLAGLTVVPAFRELTQFILNYYNVPPDNLVNQP